MEKKEKKAPWYVITGLDGAGKTTLINRLKEIYSDKSFVFRLPYSDFVIPLLKISGKGTSFGDTYTDRLIFTLDSKLANKHLKKWREEYEIVISQRGWMDNYIHGKVQKMNYKDTNTLLHPNNLEKPTAIIFLNAKSEIAYSRIKDDKNADKYETLEYIKKQAKETENFYNEMKKNNIELKLFHNIPCILIDTTDLTPEDVFVKARDFLENLK